MRLREFWDNASTSYNKTYAELGQFNAMIDELLLQLRFRNNLNYGCKMGDGYWLNPKINQHWLVSRHETWILDPQNARLSGIPEQDLQRLRTLNPIRSMDEIRMAGVKAGLVRIRSHKNHISVQFAAPVSYTEEVMRSIFNFLDKIEGYKDTPVAIDNFGTGESTQISLAEIGMRLGNNEAILR